MSNYISSRLHRKISWKYFSSFYGLFLFLFANFGDFYFGLGFGMLFWFTVQILLYLPVLKDYKKEYRWQIYWLERFWISFFFLLYFTNEGSLSSHVFVYSYLFGPTFFNFLRTTLLFYYIFIYIFSIVSLAHQVAFEDYMDGWWLNVYYFGNLAGIFILYYCSFKYFAYPLEFIGRPRDGARYSLIMAFFYFTFISFYVNYSCVTEFLRECKREYESEKNFNFQKRVRFKLKITIWPEHIHTAIKLFFKYTCVMLLVIFLLTLFYYTVIVKIILVLFLIIFFLCYKFNYYKWQEEFPEEESAELFAFVYLFFLIILLFFILFIVNKGLVLPIDNYYFKWAEYNWDVTESFLRSILEKIFGV